MRCMTVVDVHDRRCGEEREDAESVNALPGSCGSACLHAP